MVDLTGYQHQRIFIEILYNIYELYHFYVTFIDENVLSAVYLCRMYLDH
jgi:hypothetical protein